MEHSWFRTKYPLVIHHRPLLLAKASLRSSRVVPVVPLSFSALGSLILLSVLPLFSSGRLWVNDFAAVSISPQPAARRAARLRHQQRSYEEFGLCLGKSDALAIFSSVIQTVR